MLCSYYNCSDVLILWNGCGFLVNSFFCFVLCWHEKWPHGQCLCWSFLFSLNFLNQMLIKGIANYHWKTEIPINKNRLWWNFYDLVCQNNGQRESLLEHLWHRQMHVFYSQQAKLLQLCFLMYQKKVKNLFQLIQNSAIQVLSRTRLSEHVNLF